MPSLISALLRRTAAFGRNGDLSLLPIPPSFLCRGLAGCKQAASGAAKSRPILRYTDVGARSRRKLTNTETLRRAASIAWFASHPPRAP